MRFRLRKDGATPRPSTGASYHWARTQLDGVIESLLGGARLDIDGLGIADTVLAALGTKVSPDVYPPIWYHFRKLVEEEYRRTIPILAALCFPQRKLNKSAPVNPVYSTSQKGTFFAKSTRRREVSKTVHIRDWKSGPPPLSPKKKPRKERPTSGKKRRRKSELEKPAPGGRKKKPIIETVIEKIGEEIGEKIGDLLRKK